MKTQREGWRIRIAAQMLRAARGLEFFSLAVLRPDDFVAFTRLSYTDPSLVHGLVEKTARGLYPHELAAVEKFAPLAGVALVLGCGAGREAIALSQRGWDVTAVDLAPAAIAAAKVNAAAAGARVDWRCQDVTSGLVLDRSFDLVCLFGYVYSLIPDRNRRILLLRTCRQHTTEAGVCLLDFARRPSPSDLEHRAHRWRRRLARAVRGNVECQIGDQWQLGRLFFHSFGSVEEVVEEASTAGFMVETDANRNHAALVVLRPKIKISNEALPQDRRVTSPEPGRVVTSHSSFNRREGD